MSSQIETIISSRANKPSSNESLEENSKVPHQIHLDDLPMVMLSYIASFLNLKETLHFEKTNRDIFIGTRSPISLKTLEGKAFSNCLSYSNDHSRLYNFYRFRCIQQLTIDALDRMEAFYYADD
eukprot:69040_1